MARVSLRHWTLCAATAPAAVTVLGLFSCGAPPAPPDDVAKTFWEAMRAEDLEAAANEVTHESAHLLDSEDVPDSIDTILVGEVLSNERSAIVRTSMATRDEGVSLNVVFNTHLAREGDRWKAAATPSWQLHMLRAGDEGPPRG